MIKSGTNNINQIKFIREGFIFNSTLTNYIIEDACFVLL